MAPPNVPLYDKLTRYIDRRGADECWPWKGSVDQFGYAQMRYAGRTRRVTRLLLNASPGQVVMHSCNNGWCCNPGHMKTGTHQENNVDALRDGRRTGVTAPKFTLEEAEEIRRSPVPTRKLAEQHGVSYSVIYDIRRYRTYVLGKSAYPSSQGE